MTYVAEFTGGPAHGHRRTLAEGIGTPHELVVPAADFGGQVDATYVFGGGSHSVGIGPWKTAYHYRLPNGQLDTGPDRLDPNEDAARKLRGESRTALQTDGTVLVWYADGPMAGTHDVWSASVDDHAAPNVDPSQHPIGTMPYRFAGRLEVRGGVAYDIYLYAPN